MFKAVSSYDLKFFFVMCGVIWTCDLILLVGWQERHLACKKYCTSKPQRFFRRSSENL